MAQFSAFKISTLSSTKKDNKTALHFLFFELLRKVGADVFENCNQKCQEGVSSKTLYQGMEIIHCRLLKTSRCVFLNFLQIEDQAGL